MTQQRIDDLQKAIKTGLPIEINPKAVLEIISILAAEKKRADAAGQELERMRKWFSENSAMLATHRIGGCHFADDGLGAENTDAPTGAESEEPHA